MKKGKLIISVRGGLCNRLRFLASAVHAARLTSRELHVGWSLGDGIRMRYEDFFEPINGVSFYYDNSEISKMAISVASTIGVCDDIMQWNNSQDLLSIGCGGVMASGIPVRDCTKKGIACIVPKPEIINFVESYVDKNFSGKVVGLHIRAKEYFGEMCPVSKYEEILDNIKEDVTVYLSTDIEDVALRIMKRYNKWHSFISRLFKRRVKVLYIKKPLERCSRRGMKWAVIELYMLNNCLRIYGTVDSSYNWMASIIDNDVPLIKVE